MSGFPAIIVGPGGAMPADTYTQEILRKKLRDDRRKKACNKPPNKYGFKEDGEDERQDDDRPHHHHSSKKSKASGGYNAGGGGYSGGGYSGGYGGGGGYNEDNVRKKPKSDRYGAYGSEDQNGSSSKSSKESYSRGAFPSSSKNRSNFVSDSDSDDGDSSRNYGNQQRSSGTGGRNRDPFGEKVGSGDFRRNNNSGTRTRGDPFASSNQQQYQEDDNEDDDGGNYANNNYQQPSRKADPFSPAGGAKANAYRRGDPFANNGNNDYSDDDGGYSQPQPPQQRSRGDPFASNGNDGQRSGGGFPQAKQTSQGNYDPFGSSPNPNINNFQQPQQQPQPQRRGDPFANNQGSGGGYPTAKKNNFGGQQQQFPQRRGNPFGNADDNDEDDEIDPGFSQPSRSAQRNPFQNSPQQQQQPQGFPQRQQQQQQFPQTGSGGKSRFPQTAQQPMSPDELLFGGGGFSQQQRPQQGSNDNNFDDLLNLDVAPRTTQQNSAAQNKADPLAEYGGLVNLDFGNKPRERGKAIPGGFGNQNRF